jgi:hypothetical protein
MSGVDDSGHDSGQAKTAACPLEDINGPFLL